MGFTALVTGRQLGSLEGTGALEHQFQGGMRIWKAEILGLRGNPGKWMYLRLKVTK
jgi:hypothetical protein